MFLQNEDGSNQLEGQGLYFHECHGRHEGIPDNAGMRVWHSGQGTMIALSAELAEGLDENAELILFAPNTSGVPVQSELIGFPGLAENLMMSLGLVDTLVGDPEEIPDEAVEAVMQDIERKYQARKEAGTLSPSVGDMFQAATFLVAQAPNGDAENILKILQKVSEALD